MLLKEVWFLDIVLACKNNRAHGFHSVHLAYNPADAFVYNDNPQAVPATSVNPATTAPIYSSLVLRKNMLSFKNHTFCSESKLLQHLTKLLLRPGIKQIVFQRKL